MDRAQKVAEKNAVICRVIMFTSRVIVIRMSRMSIFADENKKSVI